jgi:3-oxoacyl-[acyl-carrier-protein] synthase II
MSRVVITGMGVLCSLGNSVAALRDALLDNRSGIERCSWSEIPGLGCGVIGTVKNLEPKRIPRTHRRTMGRSAQLATFAAEQAVADAGLTPDQLSSPRTGIAMGSTIGSPEAIEQFFASYLESGSFELTEGTTFMKVMGHSVAANVASVLNVCGPMLGLCSACASSTQAVGAGFEAIRRGEQDIMICGGAESVHPTTLGVFDILHAASRRYNDQADRTPRPFDSQRDGMVLSEAGAVVVLESLEHAQRRGAVSHAELCGYATCTNVRHMTQPDAPSMRQCMEMAVASAGITPNQLNYINAHATGTLAGDEAEADALRQFVGSRVAVSATKGYTGHALAASGSLELIICLTMMRESLILPTRNLDQIDPACEGIEHILEPRPADLTYVLTSNFAFGGVSASLVVRRV